MSTDCQRTQRIFRTICDHQRDKLFNNNANVPKSVRTTTDNMVPIKQRSQVIARRAVPLT